MDILVLELEKLNELGEIREGLNSNKEHSIGKALIRFNVLPDRYWDVRNKIESCLVGETTVHLYQISGMIYIMEMLKSESSNHSATG